MIDFLLEGGRKRGHDASKFLLSSPSAERWREGRKLSMAQ
jgi:hypothetical protein